MWLYIFSATQDTVTVNGKQVYNQAQTDLWFWFFPFFFCALLVDGKVASCQLSCLMKKWHDLSLYGQWQHYTLRKLSGSSLTFACAQVLSGFEHCVKCFIKTSHRGIQHWPPEHKSPLRLPILAPLLNLPARVSGPLLLWGHTVKTVFPKQQVSSLSNFIINQRLSTVPGWAQSPWKYQANLEWGARSTETLRGSTTEHTVLFWTKSSHIIC